jgi:beta-aspartyl-peptidase (threonine type)
MPKHQWTLAVHGGAGSLYRDAIPVARDAKARAALRQALQSGGDVLAAGGSATDAVQVAVRVLEDCPLFNAGCGSVLTAAGTFELDAAIMDGATLRAGAVAGVSTTRNPICLARAVMDHSDHVMLTGKDAETVGRAQGLESAGHAYFETVERRDQLHSLLRAGNRSVFDSDLKYGTVGAVARDSDGHVAAATSTGGLTGKHPGRIGDSPVIGAGTYADDRAGAVSATGSGEHYIRAGAAAAICSRIRYLNEPALQAADAVQAEVLALGGRRCHRRGGKRRGRLVVQHIRNVSRPLERRRNTFRRDLRR